LTDNVGPQGIQTHPFPDKAHENGLPQEWRQAFYWFKRRSDRRRIKLRDHDLGPSVALPVPEMLAGGAADASATVAAGSVELASCCAASAAVRLVSASGPAAKPASVRILSMIGLNWGKRGGRGVARLGLRGLSRLVRRGLLRGRAGGPEK
jgi:hypothetical protein